MILISNPHDKLFKQIWSDRETAADFLANYLPADICDLIDLKTLEICKDSFVDKNLTEYFPIYFIRYPSRVKPDTFICYSSTKAILKKPSVSNCFPISAAYGNFTSNSRNYRYR
jgi:hypothetical protein